MSTLAVVSNMALFCFTGNQLSEAGWSWQSRIVFFSVRERARRQANAERKPSRALNQIPDQLDCQDMIKIKE